VGGLYHPPNPCYEVSGLYDHSENSLERLLESNPGASVVLAGDFKKLDLAEVSARVGLLPLVSQPTRGTKVLDMIMTSDPLSYSIKVITSLGFNVAYTQSHVVGLHWTQEY